MKSFLQTILLLGCQFIFAQTLSTPEIQLKTDSTQISLNKRIEKTESVNPDKSKIPYDIKTDNKKSVAMQDFDVEIRAILDYRLNRVLREDLFCLICEAESTRGQLA